MHLSAPEGIGINDYIDKEDFPIHYATVDDAVAMVTEYGKECIQARIDLKAAFHCEWDLLGLHLKGKYYVDTCMPAFRSSVSSVHLETLSDHILGRHCQALKQEAWSLNKKAKPCTMPQLHVASVNTAC